MCCLGERWNKKEIDEMVKGSKLDDKDFINCKGKKVVNYRKNVEINVNRGTIFYYILGFCEVLCGKGGEMKRMEEIP